jgi:WD40 repeat protein
MSRHVSFKALAYCVLLVGTVGTLAFHSTGTEQPTPPSIDELPPPSQDTIDYLASIDPRTLLPRVPGTEKVLYDNEGQPLPPLPADIRCRLGKWAPGCGYSDYGPAVQVAGSPDGKLAAIASDDGLVRIFDLPTGRQITQLNHERGLRPFAVVFTPDNKRLFVGSINPLHGVDVAFKELATGDESHTCVGQLNVRTAAISPDLTLLALAGRDRTLEIRELASGAVRYSALQDQPANTLAFSPDGASLAMRDGQGTINVIDWTTGRKGKEWHSPGLLRGHLQFMPDGKRVLYQDGGEVRVWDLESGKPVLSNLPNPNPHVVDVGLSADGRTLATFGDDASVRLWEIRTGLQRRSLSAAGKKSYGVALQFTPDGRSLIGGLVNGNGVVWSLDPAGKKAGADDLESWWELLNSPTSGEAADEAVRALAATPKVVPFLLRRARAPQPGELSPKEIERCLADLDAAQFDVRETATEALGKQGARIKLVLEKAQAATKSGEVHRRIAGLLEGIGLEVEDLRLHRVIEVLESIGTDEAREALKELAEPGPSDSVRADARSSAERLARQRPNTSP